MQEQEVQTTLPLGTIVQGRYVIEGVLGKGGFGTVYLVRDRRAGQKLFALKEMVGPNRRERKRFFFEGELLQRLDHPALPRVYRVFEDEKHNRAYMLMDYIDGQNLEALRRRQPRKCFPVQQLLAIMKPIVDAVSYLHNQCPPIIHRDIKPSNIIVMASDNEAVLVDFGIAKEYDPDITTSAVHHCSPGYGAPEQYGRGTNMRTDIYSLGATIYTLLTGVVPTDAFYRTLQLLSKGSDPLEPLNQLAPAVPPQIADAVHRAMAINSSDRFSSVEQFWEALWAPHTSPREHLSCESGSMSSVSSRLPMAPEHERAADLPAATSHKEKRAVERSSSFFSRKAGLLISLALLISISVGLALNQLTASPALPSPAITSPRFTATSGSGTYPTVVWTYKGTLYDLPLHLNTSMALIGVRQSQGYISGYLTIDSKLLGSGHFSGTITAAGELQFIVTDSAGHATFFFDGLVQSPTSLSGDYYRCSRIQGEQCKPSRDDYGIWSVALVSS